MLDVLLKLNRFNNNLFVRQVFTRLNSSDMWINLTCHSNCHSNQPPFNYSAFPSQQLFIIGPSNLFATSTMIPHLPIIQCHPCSIINQQCLHKCPWVVKVAYLWQKEHKISNGGDINYDKGQTNKVIHSQTR